MNLAAEEELDALMGDRVHGHDDDGWLKRRACEGIPVALFYPKRGQRPPEWVIDVCKHSCPVRNDCLQRADPNFGWWGGVSPRHPSRRVTSAGPRANFDTIASVGVA